MSRLPVWRRLPWAVALSLCPWIVWAQEAEILDLQGPGDRRASEALDWQAAQSRQRVAPGGFVRTRAAARMALLLADQTQIRLNQHTVLQVKSIAAPNTSAPSPTRLLLSQGRAWTQTRNVGAGGPLTVDTPAATAAIRGTDWELDVGPDGRTQLTVLSGTVRLSNAQGSLDVGRNEAALVEVGKAPVRLQLSNPRERVQWVQALTAQPLRHIDATQIPPAYQGAWAALQQRDRAALARQLGTTTDTWSELLRAADDTLAGHSDSAAERLNRVLSAADAPPTAHLMRADLQLVAGESDAAVQTLQAGLGRHPGDPDLRALLARAHMLADRLDAAQQTVAPSGPDQASTSLWLARGDLARRQGQVRPTLEAYTRARDTAPNDPRAWLALGSAQGEREDVTAARAALTQALTLAREQTGALGELATVEAQANRLAQAETLFNEALQAQPGDYVAQTGLGLLRLKQGRPAEALDALLRAGVMEPRYSRAASFTAVAYYQLGRRDDARAALRRAIELDDKDPVPHLLLAQIHTDHFEADDAVQAARAAVARLPYLKSLNQVANNQQGSANFGASLAFFGLEDWALELAHRSDYPYWGGSHLFLADRYPGEFHKNSRLFQGFLTDPLAFGASPGYSSLLQRAGAYGTVGVNIDHEWARLTSPYASVNGLFNQTFPIALFGKLQTVEGDGYPIDVGVANIPAFFDPSGRADVRARVGTVGLGLQPTERLNLFVYGNRFDVGLRGRNQVLGPEGEGGSNFDHAVGQGVIGAAWKWSPTAQSWLKLGRSSERTDLSNYPVAFAEQDFLGVLGFFAQPIKRLSDLQWRHTADWGEGRRLILGLELGRESQRSEAFALGPVYALSNGQEASDVLAFGGTNQIERRLQTWHLGWQQSLGKGWQLDSALAHHRLRERIQGENSVALLGNETATSEQVDVNRRARTWTPRLGLAWVPTERDSLRLAYQDWLRPLSVNTLAPVETAGIAADDRLVQAGGRSRSLAVQWGHSPDTHSFWLLRADTQRVRNPGTLGVDLRTPSLPFLEELRNQQLDNLSANDLLEDDPDFERGRLHRLSIGASRMLSRQWSAYVRWVRASGRVEGVDALSGTGSKRHIPYVARHTLVLGSTWSGGPRVYLSGRLVWRGQRFEDDRNLTALPAGWGMDLMGLWESPDKRWLVGVAALNLGAPKSDRRTQRYVVDARYRF